MLEQSGDTGHISWTLSSDGTENGRPILIDSFTQIERKLQAVWNLLQKESFSLKLYCGTYPGPTPVINSSVQKSWQRFHSSFRTGSTLVLPRSITLHPTNHLRSFVIAMKAKADMLRVMS